VLLTRRKNIKMKEMINPTNIKFYAIDSLVQACETKFYEFDIYVLNDEFLKLPETVKRKYEPGQAIMLSIRNDLNPDISFDYERAELTWYTAFGGVDHQVVVPADNVMAMVDKHNNCAVQFSIVDPNIKSRDVPEPLKKTETIKTLKKTETIKTLKKTVDELAKPGTIIRERKHLKLIKGG